MAKRISAGLKHTCIVIPARNTTSSIYSCGDQSSNQLGDQSANLLPNRVPNFTTVISVASGGSHTVIVLSNGTVWSIGSNTNGQLGLGDTLSTTTFTQVSGITTATTVACGSNHTIIRLSDGTIRTFGLNTSGQLGLGNTTSPRTSPQLVTGITTATSIAGGGSHTIICLSDGTIRTFGLNTSGQLGLGNTTSPQTSPQTVTGITTAVHVACAVGGAHTIVVLSDGTLRSFGFNGSGQLGLGNTISPRSSPQTVSNITTGIAAACGQNHTIVYLSDGTIRTFGANGNGQLGLGNTTLQTSPGTVFGITTATAVACGSSCSFVILSNGTLLSFGGNSNSQLGYFNIVSILRPTIPAIASVTAVACGENHTIILSSEGTVWGFGRNLDGQLGLGDTITRNTPTQITSITTATSISCGHNYTMILLSNGTVQSFGWNGSGNLGLGNTISPQTSPQTISDIITADAITCGQNHTIIRLLDGTLRSFGLNTSGQLGLGNTVSPVMSPQTIPGITTAISVACGSNYTIVCLSNGTVQGFGENGNGQLGLSNTTSPQISPQIISGITTAIEVACGISHTIIRLSNGIVLGFGRNVNGELGLGNTTSPQTSPQTISSITASEIACGHTHTVIRLSDGTFRTFGLNTNGQLGDGTTTQQTSPVTMNFPLGYVMSTPFKSAGPISFSELAEYFGGTISHSLNEYYGVASGVPSSGEISMDVFYNKL